MTTQNGKVATVTGASRGVGAAIAQRLAADGLAVVVNYAGGADEAQAQATKINAVAPGPTAIALSSMEKPQNVVERLSKLAPLERLGQPGEIAATVAFLAEPDGGWINGQVLRANGDIV